MNEQLIFNLTRRSAFNREDYFISSTNNLSIKILDNWNKSFGTGLIIVGPSACGKSHLAAVWSKDTSAIFYNFSTFVETDIKNIIKEHFIVLEDVEMLKLISDKKVLKKVYLFSLNIKNIILATTRKNKWIPLYKQYPIVPKMERDINFIFNKKYLVSEIIFLIKRSGNKLLEDVNLIDVYEDKNFGTDFISYTFRLSYRDPEKTLVDSDIALHHQNIVKIIEKEFSTKLRE